MSNSIIFDRDDRDLIVSFAGCTLNTKPGKNWVEGAGGLPEYICRIARAMVRGGKSVSTAIAIAVSRVKKWAAGVGDVNADTRAKAAKAVAQWEALKAKNKVKKGAKKAGKRGSKDKVEATYRAEDILCLAKTEFNTEIVRRAFDKRTDAVREQWRKANPSGDYRDQPAYYWIRELWTNFILVESDSADDERKMFKVPYTVNEDLSVTFEDPVEVRTEYVVVDSDDAPGGDISDADLQKAIDLAGPCPRSDVTDLVVLTIGKPPARSPLEQLLDAAGKNG